MRERQGADVVAWGYADLDKLRTLDPKRFTLPERGDTGVVLLFGSWYEVLRQAHSIQASIRWSTTELAATLELPVSKPGRPSTIKGYVPDGVHGSAPSLHPPGTIASLSLWRDWATFWESRADLFPPETVQGFAQLDTLAGQFFGGREFGPDVLGAVRSPLAAGRRPARLRGTQAPARRQEPRVRVRRRARLGRLRFRDAVQDRLSGDRRHLQRGWKSEEGAVLELGSEEVEGIKMATARFLVPRTLGTRQRQALQRYNFTPATAQVGKYLIFSSSTGLARDLVKELKSNNGNMSRGRGEGQFPGGRRARAGPAARDQSNPAGDADHAESGRDQGESRAAGRAEPRAASLPWSRPARRSR